MKQTIMICGFSLLLLGILSCESAEEQASHRLLQAQRAFESGRYGDAKSELDSVRILYPKAFETRKAALRLMQRVDSAEQQRSVFYCDSMIALLKPEVERLQKSFILQKDTEYQEVGNYMDATQTVEKNLNRTYLCGQVSEKGSMLVTSVYNGGRALNHKGIKVSSGGVFAETPLSADAYYTENLGVVTEKSDFALGSDGGLIAFIVLNREHTIKVELTGGGKQSYTLRKSDAAAIARLYELAQRMQSLNETYAVREEALRHLQFIEHRKQR